MKYLGIILVGILVAAQAASAVTLYRETFPQLGGWTKAGLWESTPPSGRNGLSQGQGWFGYSPKASLSSGTIQPFGNPWGFNCQAATWIVGSTKIPAIPVSPGESDSTQVNSAVNASGGVAFGNTVPAGLVLGTPYGDLQTSTGVPSALGWSPMAVYDAVCFTQEYQFNLASASRLQFEVTTNNNMNYRFLIHIGNDFDSEFPGGDSPTATLGTGWYASDLYNVTGSPDGSNVWTTLSLDVNANTHWYGVGLEMTGGDGFYVGGPAMPSGAVTAFGMYLGNPNGNQRFDNYTVFGVPEPATMTLLGLGVFGLLPRRK